MEQYQVFLDRIHSFETKELYLGEGDFIPNPSVSLKVDAQNRFSPFYGDTVVFNLDNITKANIANHVEYLYRTCPECFCEKLHASTFHMTLHDLSNNPLPEKVAVQMLTNQKKVAEIMTQIKPLTIRMKSNYIFNMVNTSLVLGLYPVNEEEYNKLMTLYHFFDDVVRLNYPLTPHITLAYYNRNGFEAAAAHKLKQIVHELNQNPFEILLDARDLNYQNFTSMNDYINVFSLFSKTD